MAYNITAESIPILDGWGYDDHWSLTDWVTWHKALRNKFSSENKTVKDTLGRVFNYNKSADTIWLREWNKQSFGAEPINSLLNVGSDSFKYIKQNILLFTTTGAIQQDYNLSNPTAVKEAVADVAEVVGDVVESTVKTVKTGFKILKYGTIAVLSIGVILGTVYVVYKVKKIKKATK